MNPFRTIATLCFVCSLFYLYWLYEDYFYVPKQALYAAALFATAAFLWDLCYRFFPKPSIEFKFGLLCAVILYALSVSHLASLYLIENSLRHSGAGVEITQIDFEEINSEHFDYPVGFKMTLFITSKHFEYIRDSQVFLSLSAIPDYRAFTKNGVGTKSIEGDIIKYEFTTYLTNFNLFQRAQKNAVIDKENAQVTNRSMACIQKYKKTPDQHSFRKNLYIKSKLSKQRIDLKGQLKEKLLQVQDFQDFEPHLPYMSAQFTPEKMNSFGWFSDIGQCEIKNIKYESQKYKRVEQTCYCKKD